MSRGRQTQVASDQFLALEIDECLALLDATEVGRLAFIEGDELTVLPVNYRLVEGAIVYRTGFGHVLDALSAGPRVAFEIDGTDAQTWTGWSVLVRGRAEEVADLAELEQLRTSPPRPWAPGTKEHYVRILPSHITGRRITRTTDLAWHG